MTDLLKQRHSTPAENLRVLLALRWHTFSVAERLEIEEAADALESANKSSQARAVLDSIPQITDPVAIEILKGLTNNALESAGELPEPDKVYHYGKEEFDRVDKSYADNLRTAYSALAARLREREAHKHADCIAQGCPNKAHHGVICRGACEKLEYGDKVVFLIEYGKPPRYWSGIGEQFTYDHEAAIRLPRKIDADAICNWLRKGGREWDVIEHSWSAP